MRVCGGEVVGEGVLYTVEGQGHCLYFGKVLAAMFPQCSVEQRCAELQSLLETERSRVCELGACQEQLERRARELDMEVTTVRAEAERERDRLTSQAEVRWGHCVCTLTIPHFLWVVCFC